MRFKDFNVAEAALGGDTDDKYLVGVNKILLNPNPQLLVGPKAERGTLLADPGQQVTSRKDAITGTLAGRKVKVKVTQLFKSDEIKAGSGVSLGRSQKETFVIKPSQIFSEEKFSAERVFEEIINNNTLVGTDIGEIIIDMARQIQGGKLPNFKDIDKKFQTTIRDYAGEYLGVCALLKGIANFPNQKQWYSHLGVKDLNDIFIHFPKAANNPLGDSIGSFENTETGNMILISSKGGAKGAPPSLNGLKIPDEIASKPGYKNEVDFVQTLQQSSADVQPFRGINKLFELVPDKIDPIVKTILPLTIHDINEIITFFDKSQYTKQDWVNLPKKYHPVIGLIQQNLKRFKDTATPGGILHYVMNKQIMQVVNEKKAFPNFEPLAREILQKNFIQIFARPTATTLGFDVVWPNVEMGIGKIQLYSKASANDPKSQKMSFSVT